MKKVFFVKDANHNRVDVFLKQNIPDMSRSEIKKKILTLTINGKKASLSDKIKQNDRIEADFFFQKFKKSSEFTTPDIFYQEETFVIIFKKAGEIVHPGSGTQNQLTIADRIKDLLKYPATLFEDPKRAGIVHRLDKETSGLLFIARTPEAESAFKKKFKNRTIEKKYRALVHGNIIQGSFFIENPIGPHPQNFKKRKVFEPEDIENLKTSKIKMAKTGLTVMKRLKDYTLVDISLFTGRTHQIRVHTSSIGHPVCGDRLYGKKDLFSVMMLIAYELSFENPLTQKKHHFRLKKDQIQKIFPEKLFENINEFF